MSIKRVIKLGESFGQKYAQTNFQSEAIDRAIKILESIVSGNIVFGKDRAQRMLTYLIQKKNDPNFKVQKFADASYMDRIIANMVYSNVPDETITYNAKLLLYVFQDQELELTGSFKEAFIPNTIDRYKTALKYHQGQGNLADEWSRSGMALRDFQPKSPKATV